MADIGETVLVHCIGTLDGGAVFLNSRLADEPLRVKIGSGMLLPKVEAALCDMFPGDRKAIRLEPAQAYGIYDEQLVQCVPTQLIPNAEQLPCGGFIELKTKMGPVRAKVLSVDANQVVLDCNHELAGRSVIFDVELLSIARESAVNRELHPSGCACGCDKLKAQLMAKKIFGVKR